MIYSMVPSNSRGSFTLPSFYTTISLVELHTMLHILLCWWILYCMNILWAKICFSFSILYYPLSFNK